VRIIGILLVVSALVTAGITLIAAPRAEDGTATERTRPASSATVVAIDVVVVDISRSMQPVFTEMRGAAFDLMKMIPDGDNITILEVGTVITPVLTASVSSASRAQATETLERMTPKATHTDLGAALATASSLLALSPAKHNRIFLFTDGDPRPQAGTRFAGRSFEELLRDRDVLGPEVQLFIVLPAAAKADPNGPSNVHVVRPGELPKMQTPARLPLIPLPPPADTDLVLWHIASGGVIAVVVVLSVGAVLRHRRQRLQRDADELALSELPPAEERPAPLVATPRTVSGFIVTIGEREIPLHAEMASLTIGNLWDADVYIPGDPAGTAGVRLSVDQNGKLQCVNAGQIDAFAGALRLKPGAARALPIGPVTLRFGPGHVAVMPTNSISLSDQR